MYAFATTLPRPDVPFETYFKQNYIFWSGCASSEMVDSIVALGDSLDAVDATIGTSAKDSTLHSDTRVSSISWMFNNPASQFVYDFVQDKIDRINYHNYGFALHGMEVFQYTRYPVGGHYVYHNDIVINQDGMRKLSIVMSLSDSADYEGGNFLFMPHGQNPEVMRFQKGDLIAFPSWIPHKVEPVTQGLRRTLVTWAYGPTIV